MGLLLQTIKLTKSFGDYEVLKDISLTISEGEKIGIVGLNGAGKSTLIRILAGELAADSGEIIWHRHCQIGYLKQISEEKEGFGTLSGGERTKKRLLRCLKNNVSVLILDEPTNHLDEKGMTWLIDEVKAFKGTVIVISHDRYFLDQCVLRIEEIENGKNQSFAGNYSWYRKEKKRLFDAATKAYEEQEKKKQSIREEMQMLKNWSAKAHREAGKKAIETGNKFGGKQHNRAKAKAMDRRVHSQLMRLQKIEVEGMQRPQEERSVYFQLGKEAQKGHRILCAQGLEMAYEEKVLFKNSDFYILRGERVGIIGPNGCGKSTLLRILLGEEKAKGKLFFSETRKIGYMSQEILDLDPRLTVQESFRNLTRQEESWLRNQLSSMGIGERLYHNLIGSLSMGERMKIKLLQMILEGSELLILDEPTNHMDLMMREQLEEVLASYEGTLILVSHDRYLVEKVCDHLLVFEDQRISRFEGTLSEYSEKRKEKLASSDDQKKKKTLQAQKEAALKREYRLSYLVSTLSMAVKGSAQYEALEKEYEQLLAEKRMEG